MSLSQSVRFSQSRHDLLSESREGLRLLIEAPSSGKNVTKRRAKSQLHLRGWVLRCVCGFVFFSSKFSLAATQSARAHVQIAVFWISLPSVAAGLCRKSFECEKAVLPAGADWNRFRSSAISPFSAHFLSRKNHVLKRPWTPELALDLPFSGCCCCCPLSEIHGSLSAKKKHTHQMATLCLSAVRNARLPTLLNSSSSSSAAQ